MSLKPIKRPKHPSQITGFSIGYRFLQDYTTPTPGPGQYNTEESSPPKRGPRIGNEKRDVSFISSLEFPGPGTYSIDKSQIETENLRRGSRSVVGFNSTTERDSLLFQSQTERIGPSDYSMVKDWCDLPNHKMNPTFSKFIPKDQEPDNRSPGPAAYDIVKDWAASIKPMKSGTFGFSERDFCGISNLLGESMSGATYFKYNSPDMAPERVHGPIIAQAERKGLESNADVPGPGQYPIDRSLLKKSRSYQSFQSAPRTHFALNADNILNPGPGEYQIKKGAMRSMGTKIGPAPDRNRIYDSLPRAGPGSYEFHDQFNEIAKKKNTELERIKRSILRKKYTNTPLFLKSKANMAETIQEEIQKEADVSIITKQNSPSPKLQSKKSFIDNLISNSATPGPIYKVDYNSIEGNMGRTGAPMGYGGKDSYVEIKKDIPGPGKYNITRDLADSENKNGSIGLAPRATLVSDNAKYVPGVGNYNIKAIPLNKGVIFSKSKRITEEVVKEKPKTELEILMERYFRK